MASIHATCSIIGSCRTTACPNVIGAPLSWTTETVPSLAERLAGPVLGDDRVDDQAEHGNDPGEHYEDCGPALAGREPSRGAPSTRRSAEGVLGAVLPYFGRATAEITWITPLD